MTFIVVFLALWFTMGYIGGRAAMMDTHKDPGFAVLSFMIGPVGYFLAWLEWPEHMSRMHGFWPRRIPFRRIACVFFRVKD